MNQTTYPSFGDFIARGEITWPEYWHEVNSRVHGCLNGIGGWFQRGVLGIQADPEMPGYKHLIIKPALLDSLQWAKGHHVSPYGPIEVQWERAGESYSLEVTIPENSSASVYLPADSKEPITENNIPITENRDIQLIRFEKNRAELRIGSGHYSFNSTLPD
jgi:alpha-L-rhamnosidase